jgi:hypothetical protein
VSSRRPHTKPSPCCKAEERDVGRSAIQNRGIRTEAGDQVGSLRSPGRRTLDHPPRETLQCTTWIQGHRPNTEARQGSTVLEVAHGPFLETRASSVEVSEDACVKSKSLRLFLGTTNSWNQGSLIIQISKYQQEPDASYYNEDIFLVQKEGIRWVLLYMT